MYRKPPCRKYNARRFKSRASSPPNGLVPDGRRSIGRRAGDRPEGHLPPCVSGEQEDGAPRGTATGARRMGASKRAITSAKVRAHRAGSKEVDVGEDEGDVRRAGARVTCWAFGMAVDNDEAKPSSSRLERPEGHKSASLRARACGQQTKERTCSPGQRAGEEASVGFRRRSSAKNTSAVQR